MITNPHTGEPLNMVALGELVEVFTCGIDQPYPADGRGRQPFWHQGWRVADFADAGIWVEQDVPLPGVHVMFLRPEQYRKIEVHKHQHWDPP